MFGHIGYRVEFALAAIIIFAGINLRARPPRFSTQRALR